MKVLLADDSELILETLQELLSAYKQVKIVASCKNGIETLESLRTLDPDLAIVDIKMPGLNGLEVIREIRKENKAVKLIVLTFHSSDYNRQMSIEAGADYFFSKADDFGKIAGVVEELILNKKINY
jgi:two-component system response regulator (stage 0 sporulation protein A)